MKILIVGASSGLGAALTLRYLQNGHSVIATGRRISRIAKLIPAGADASLIKNDLLQPNSVGQLFAEHFEVDLVYHCAAVVDPAPVSEMMTVNFESFVQLVEAFDGVERKIVAISSLAAVIPFEHLPSYCATKAALEAWIASSRSQCRSEITVVRPGPFDSELFEKADSLVRSKLPIDIADRIILAVSQGHTDIFLGGWRDLLAARLAPIIGGTRSRRLVLGS